MSKEMGVNQNQGVAPIGQVSKPRMLIIDDDSAFGVLLSALARKKGFEPQFAPSLLSLGSFACIRDFEIVVADYYMDSVRGDEIAHYAQMFTMDVPVIIISGRHFSKGEQEKWPSCVKDFVAKDQGAEKIIDSAIEVLKRQEFLRRFGGGNPS